VWPFKPSVPNISNESGVINWFLNYDDKASEAKRKFPSANLEVIKKSILKDVLDNNSFEKLTKVFKELEQKHTETLKHMALMSPNFESFSRDEMIQFGTLGFDEVFYIVELRILGYFLLKKYGLDPRKI
jgi:predicted rRNA methylase YqxC with S4 and FtsJ domains